MTSSRNPYHFISVRFSAALDCVSVSSAPWSLLTLHVYIFSIPVFRVLLSPLFYLFISSLSPPPSIFILSSSYQAPSFFFNLHISLRYLVVVPIGRFFKFLSGNQISGSDIQLVASLLMFIVFVTLAAKLFYGSCQMNLDKNVNNTHHLCNTAIVDRRLEIDNKYAMIRFKFMLFAALNIFSYTHFLLGN